MSNKYNDYSAEVAEELIPINERVKRFSTMLDTIESVDDKKKQLWREIYTNAITDRHNALMCYNDLMMQVIGKNTSNEHAIHGPNLSKYIERMSRSNDQLIKLAELVAATQEKSEELNPDDIYSKLAES